MKRFSKSMSGVTLLEILLVLAIAAMIIVMSVRYYQSASANQQANALYSQIESITAAVDSLVQGVGTYADIDTTKVTDMLPKNGMVAPWGGAITIGKATVSTYPVTVKTPPKAVCTLILARLQTDNHYTSPACPGTGGDLTYTYTANP